MKRILEITGILALLALGWIGGTFLPLKPRREQGNEQERRDTLFFRDTFFVDRPVPKPYAVYLPSDTVRLTTAFHDTVEVIVPMEQKHYSDSLYDAWVSGYKPALDSIRLYQTTKVVTIMREPPLKRWGVGPQVGVGFSPQGFAVPYVGIGIHYDLLTF